MRAIDHLMTCCLAVSGLLSGSSSQLTGATLGAAPDIQWQQTLGGTNDDGAVQVRALIDGGIVVGAWSASPSSGNKRSASFDVNPVYGGDYWLIKLDSGGGPLWDESYGGSDADYAPSLHQGAGSGFILGGRSLNSSGGRKRTGPYGQDDIWIVRVDDSGRMAWEQSLGGSGWDTFWDLVSVDEGTLIAGASTSTPSGTKSSPWYGGASSWDSDGWVAWLDNSGTKIWDRSFGGYGPDVLRFVLSLRDGTFALAGYTESIGGNNTSPNFGGEDAWLIKIDATGTKLWEQSYGGIFNERVAGVIETADGGFMIGATSASPASGNKSSAALDSYLPGGSSQGGDFWVIRTDEQGNKLWDRSYGSSGVDYLYGIDSTVDGGAILTGVTYDEFLDFFEPTDFRVVRINAAGDVLWDRSFGSNVVIASIMELEDGGILLGGSSAAPPNEIKRSPHYGSFDGWLVRLDASGNVLFDLALGGSGDDYLNGIDRTADGGFVVALTSSSGKAGNKTSAGFGGYDVWVVKLGPERSVDSDGDGVADKNDLCPGTPPGDIVDRNGCSIDQLCPCAAPWKNHGMYLRALRQVVDSFLGQNLITPRQKQKVLNEAARSSCGR